MKYKPILLLSLAVLFFVSTQASAQELKLVPEPKQLQRHDLNFTITSKTRIVINTAHSEEDRTAAETLVEEIEGATGQKLRITTSKSMPKSDAIYLARVADDRRMDSVLVEASLGIDDKFNEEGYALEVNSSRVIIAARAGEGVFYGAQTLRQLIHPNGAKQAIVPAV